MDDTLCDYQAAYNNVKKQNPSIQYPQSQPNFFLSLEPLANAIDALKFLLVNEQFDPYILTAPSIQNPLSYTEKRLWVEKHLGMEYVERLIISSNKSLLKGDFLIDDYIEGKGQESFEGQLIHFASKNYPDWNSIISFFKSMV